MLETFNYETKELRATNRVLQTYIASCHKESERGAAYTEQNTTHFHKVANINIDSDSITPHKKQSGIEEDHYKGRKIPLGKNEAKMSIIAGKTIEPNASKTIESNTSNIIEQIASEQKEITRNQTSFNPHL